MLEMATNEYPYSECAGPAQIYKKVINGVKPNSLEKVESEEVREIIEQCIELKKENRPSVKELLAKQFFAEDTGFKVEICDRSELIKSDKAGINFRLRVTDMKKLKKSNPAHKENEAIEFEFTIGSDDCNETAKSMFQVRLNILCRRKNGKTFDKFKFLKYFLKIVHIISARNVYCSSHNHFNAKY